MAKKNLTPPSSTKTGKKPSGSAKISPPPSGLAEERPAVQGAEVAGRIDMVEPAPAAAGEYHLVTFNLGREEYGVEIGSVQEIIRVGQITPVPNAPKFIRGVINLRGRVIPVLNLRKRLDLPDGALTKDSRIVVVESGVKVLGMLVDRVFQVLRIPAASVDAPPSEADQSKASVRGIGKLDSRLVLIMDLNRTLHVNHAGMPAARQCAQESASP